MPRKRVAETPMGDAMFRFDGYAGRTYFVDGKDGSFFYNKFVRTN